MKTSSVRPFVAPAFFVSLIALAIWHAEGIRGFTPFCELGSVVVVPLGILAIVGARYRVLDLFKALSHSTEMPEPDEAAKSAEILKFAASAAISSGMILSLIGAILVLANIQDPSSAPRNMAVVLVSLLYGFFLSEFALSPMSRKLLAHSEKI